MVVAFAQTLPVSAPIIDMDTLISDDKTKVDKGALPFRGGSRWCEMRGIPALCWLFRLRSSSASALTRMIRLCGSPTVVLPPKNEASNPQTDQN